MEFIGISGELYAQTLIQTIFVNSRRPAPAVLFLAELVKRCDPSGKCLRFEIHQALLDNLKITDDCFRKTLQKLKKGGHIKQIGHTLYLHPNYVNVIKCDPLSGGDGIFIISPKKHPNTL